MSRKTAFQAMDISLNTIIIFAEIYYVLSKLMLCFYVLKNKAILYLVSVKVVRVYLGSVTSFWSTFVLGGGGGNVTFHGIQDSAGILYH